MNQPPVWAIILHVLGAALYASGSLGMLVIILQKNLTQTLLQLMRKFGQLAMIGVVAQILTGVYLSIKIGSEATKLPVFSVKMLLIVVAGLIAGLANQSLRKLQINDGQPVAEVDRKQLVLLILSAFIISVVIIILGVMVSESGS